MCVQPLRCERQRDCHCRAVLISSQIKNQSITWSKHFQHIRREAQALQELGAGVALLEAVICNDGLCVQREKNKAEVLTERCSTTDLLFLV